MAILVEHVREHRRHFAFIAHARASGNAVLRHAIRAETKLFASELATDLSRFPILRDWTTGDLQMLAGMFVDVMIAAIDSILEASSWGTGPPALTPEREAEITALTEKQMRLIALAVPHWRSRGLVRSAATVQSVATARPPGARSELSWSGWGDPRRRRDCRTGSARCCAMVSACGTRTPPPGSVDQLVLVVTAAAGRASPTRLAAIVGAGARPRRRRVPRPPRAREIDAGSARAAQRRAAAGARSGADAGLTRRGPRASWPLASAERVAVVPYGGGTSVVGGLVPEADGSPAWSCWTCGGSTR